MKIKIKKFKKMIDKLNNYDYRENIDCSSFRLAWHICL